ncbi:hypothetical protein [Acetobacterium woodii]|uniref:Uncharacterized protein n=1 Tax=Acetobacterium woodii (strain ATCC 29683 / DSM 1030 / JCM 2381 / KCTC 1655 / WB1) TaxID=931626 RepID=H6LC90_ACEWD|nr:hypothetical protein [Acetobacterium woodii]AFA50205.1 hypothetical protein Awo_c34810 [Acetobacterium woodii DSM 1030]
MIARLEEYTWSSYDKVIQGYQGNPIALDVEIIKDYFPTVADFVRFSKKDNQNVSKSIKNLD